MRHIFSSLYRIITRAGFLAVALILGLVFWNLPFLMNLDGFRPQLTTILEETFHCKVSVGQVTAQLMPSPGLVVSHVVFLEQATSVSVLASVNSVRLTLSPKTLLEGRLSVDTVRFMRPRFIVHRRRAASGESRWTFLALPQAKSSGGSAGIKEWQIRNGSIEFWDQTQKQTAKWVANQFSGSYQASPQTGSMAGIAAQLGRHAVVDVHFNAVADPPIQARLINVELKLVQALIHTDFPALEGSTDFTIKARLQPALKIQAAMEPVTLRDQKASRLRAQASFDNNHLHVDLTAGATVPMTLALDGNFTKRASTFRVSVDSYDSPLVQTFFHQSWVDRLTGRGRVTGQVQYVSSSRNWSWTAEGKDFGLEGTSLHLPEWSAKRDAQGFSVYVRAQSPEGGMAEIGWNRPDQATDSTLEVDVSSVTIREILEIFKLQSKARVRANGTMNPYGYEPWRVHRGSIEAVIHEGVSFEVKESDVDFSVPRDAQGAMHLDLTGFFELQKVHPQARLQGSLQNVPVTAVVESFFTPPSPLTGTGIANFTLAFPLSAEWVKGLSGPIQIEIDHGVLRALKTLYKIFSVLNLGNYLRLRIPQLSTQGIVFDNIVGRLTFQNGILSTDDLFLRSPNMNMGLEGTVDIPGKKVDTTVRLEILRFLEDVLKKAPITRWIFKKHNKIFLPLIVTLEGPWDDVDIY